MIYINYPNGKKPKPEWLERAKTLTDILINAKDKKSRDKIIDDNRDFWGEIKEWLEEFSYGKCWFTEARNTCFYWHVEHFRPKKATKGNNVNHDGYWWLAFDYLNYRLCGSVVNVKKGSFFPVRVGCIPANSPLDNCNDEDHLLIDPTRKADVDLIIFPYGEAKESEAEGWNCKRAVESIKRYNLNYTLLKNARKAIWNECQKTIEDLYEMILTDKKASEAGLFSPTRRQEINTLKGKLTAMTNKDAEFSAVARTCLLMDHRLWVRNLVA